MSMLKIGNICISKKEKWALDDVVHFTGLKVSEIVALCILAQVKAGGELNTAPPIPKRNHARTLAEVTYSQCELIVEAAKSYDMTVSRFARLSINKWLPKEYKIEINPFYLAEIEKLKAVIDE